MKCVLLAAALLIAPASFASTIDFDSATSTSNDTGFATIAATADPSWAPALPGSIWITTSNNVAPPLGATATFTVDLNVTGPFNLALLDLGVYADDTAAVTLDGTTLFAENTSLSEHCASSPIGCTDGTEGVLSDYDVTSLIHDGTNTLTFEVYQLQADTPFGVDFAGLLTTEDTAPTPEPWSLLLLGSGLLGVGSLRSRFVKRA